MPENTLLRYFFSSGSEVDPEDRFHLNRKTRTRRLKEISDILRKHHFLKGFTPEAFRAMLEDLGPSFVKIGQTLSTRSEILPKAYCDELAKLQMECDPLPFEAILEALDDIYGDAQGDVFDAIDPTPLGSASLAQVHKARLVTGEIVAVKIQRPGVKTTMAQDIDIMRMAVSYTHLDVYKRQRRLRACTPSCRWASACWPRWRTSCARRWTASARRRS